MPIVPITRASGTGALRALTEQARICTPTVGLDGEIAHQHVQRLAGGEGERADQPLDGGCRGRRGGVGLRGEQQRRRTGEQTGADREAG